MAFARLGARRLCTVPDPRPFLAGATHRGMGLAFEEALSLLQELPAEDIAAWEKDHHRAVGQRVVHCTERLSVLDTEDPDSGGGVVRSLHYNERIDLEQSAVRLDRGHIVLHDRPPPSSVQGLALALALCRPSQSSGISEAAAVELGGGCGPSIAVLGAGGCTLPCFLHEALPRCTVHSVELDNEVLGVARKFFGAARLEAESARFKLVSGCALQWAKEDAPPRSFDVVVLDVEGGGGGSLLLAPPSLFLQAESVRLVRRALAPGGVVAVNVVASSEQGLERALEHVRGALAAGGLPPVAECRICSGLGSTQQRLVFCRGDGEDATPVRSAEVAAGLNALGAPPLVDDEAAWLAGWTPCRAAK